MTRQAAKARRPAGASHRARGTTAQRGLDLAALRAERDRVLERARRQAEFISHASHEIRTPLHGIMGFSTLLLSTELTDEQRTFANSLHVSIESLLAVVNDVLDVSALDAGAMRLESEGFNLIALIRGVVDMFVDAAGAKGLVLRLDAADVKHPTVTGDPGRIRQILSNLVSNAVKFTDAGDVTVHAVTRAAGHDAIEVHVSVSDTGPGFPSTRRLACSSRFHVSASRVASPSRAPASASRFRGNSPS